MNKEVNVRLLWSRRDVMEFTGLTKGQYEKFVGARVLVPVKVKGRKYRLFRRVDVLRALGVEGAV